MDRHKRPHNQPRQLRKLAARAQREEIARHGVAVQGRECAQHGPRALQDRGGQHHRRRGQAQHAPAPQLAPSILMLSLLGWDSWCKWHSSTPSSSDFSATDAGLLSTSG